MSHQLKIGEKKRGFALMSKADQIKNARKGGAAVPAEKRSFSRNRALAAEAGRKGGQSVDPKNRTFSRDPAFAAEVGRKGALKKKLKQEARI